MPSLAARSRRNKSKIITIYYTHIRREKHDVQTILLSGLFVSAPAPLDEDPFFSLVSFFFFFIEYIPTVEHQWPESGRA